MNASFYVVDKAYNTSNVLINKIQWAGQKEVFNIGKKSTVVKARGGSFLNSIKVKRLLPYNKWTVAGKKNLFLVVRVFLLLLL